MMSERFCLIIYQTELGWIQEDDLLEPASYPVENVVVEMLEEPTLQHAISTAQEVVQNRIEAFKKNTPPMEAYESCGVNSATLLCIDDVVEIDIEGNEPAMTQTEKLERQVRELSAKADGFDTIMDVIKDFTGTDPRDVGPSQQTHGILCGPPPSASLKDIAINLLYEAVRKKAEAVNNAKV